MCRFELASRECKVNVDVIKYAANEVIHLHAIAEQNDLTSEQKKVPC